jgi:hypothetical protein
LLAGRDCEAAAKDEAARAVLLREDMSFPKVPGDFLSDNDSPDGRRDYHGGRVISELICQKTTHPRRDGGILQEERALEEVPAMQPGAKDEVPTKQGSRAMEKI